jgi:DNA end-binding protein Ku
VIQAKAEGQTVSMPAAPAAPPKVVNLMEALRRSVEQVKKPPGKAAPAAETQREKRAEPARRAQAGRRRRAG